MKSRTPGASARDVAIAAASCIALLSMIIPIAGAIRGDDQIAESIANLTTISEAHFTYASDWDGRQWTTCPDDLSRIVSHGGDHAAVPSVPFGFDCSGDTFVASRNSKYILPFGWPANCSLGSFRAFHTRPFNQYVNGRIYDTTFWAPKDPVAKRNDLRRWLEMPCEWVGSEPPPPEGGGPPMYFSTYCMALSAMYDPIVYANDSVGQTHPLDLEFGHRAPALSQALHPEQKTFMLEHYWLQNSPPEHFIPWTNGVPWFFNMGRDSESVTLFYDGHIRLMPQVEAMESDRMVQAMGRPSLIAGSDPICLGGVGYFENYGYDGEQVSSYHVFTADGILGRDTIMPE